MVTSDSQCLALFIPAVTLSPRGEKLVCASSPIAPPQVLQLTCSTQDFALWSTSGFGEGLADQTRVSAVSLADTNLRVTTTDTNSLMNPSAITLFNLTHDDHGAMVTCGGGVPSDQQSVTLSVGKSNACRLEKEWMIFT